MSFEIVSQCRRARAATSSGIFRGAKMTVLRETPAGPAYFNPPPSVGWLVEPPLPGWASVRRMACHEAQGLGLIGTRELTL